MLVCAENEKEGVNPVPVSSAMSKVEQEWPTESVHHVLGASVRSALSSAF
jgi:hypothetical protein